MDKILVAGIDTILGANLAAWLANRYDVVGLSWSKPLSIAGCETAACDPADVDAARQWIGAERPQWVVYCGPAATSSWNIPAPPAPRAEALSAATAWARAAAASRCELTLVSSDAVLTGPWMFHRESGTCFCNSSAARMLQMIEKEVSEICPESLIVRTNAFGWAPTPETTGLVESILSGLQEQQPIELDCMRHGTPILATDFAEVLERAYQHRLHGLFHLAGGERVNPFRFGCLLADQFGLSTSSLIAAEADASDRKAFGAGETSLQTRRIRKALDMPLPLLREGISRLHDQFISGYLDRFSAGAPRVVEKVA